MKSATSAILFIILFFTIAEHATASPHPTDSIYPFLSYKHFGEEDGLSSKTIYASIQDKDGFMWFATDAGVFRYDGKGFKHFTLKDGISDNEVLGLFEDHLGRIWFSTLNGNLSFWKDGKIYNRDNTNFLKNAYTKNAIFSCFEDNEKRLWFGTQSAGFLLISNDSIITKIKVSEEGKKLSSEYIYQDKEGGIWSFKKNKMYKLLENNFSDTIFLPNIVRFHCACHEKLKNEMFFYFPNGVFKVFNSIVSLVIDKTKLPENKDVLNIVSQKDYLWICTLNGCYEYKNGKFIKCYLENRVITSMIADREKNLWFNTMGESVYMLPANQHEVVNVNHSTGLSGEKIISLACQKSGSIWLGYDNGLVDKITNNRKKSYDLLKPDKRTFLRVTCLIADSDITWCGTDLGIYFIRDEKKIFIPSERKGGASPFYTIKGFFKDNSQNIWGTSTFCFLKIVHDKDGYYIQQDIDSVLRTFSMIESKKNKYLISGTNGLMEYIPDKVFNLYKTDIDLSSTRIIDMKLDMDSLLILATAGNGLYILNNRNIVQHISSDNGLTGDNCNKVCVLSNQIYVATNSGLNILKKNEGKYFITQIVTTKDGLLSNTINDIVNDDTSIYIATDKGLTILQRSVVPKKTFIGNVSVTDIITDSVQSVTSDHYVFKASIQRLIIRFAYPVFNPANLVKVKYRFLLGKGGNIKWINSESNEIELSSLVPGNYTLQLKPDIEGVTNKNITSLYFEIKPLWWQTFFFKLTVAFIILGIAIFLVRKVTQSRYERQVIDLKQQTALEVERNRIASDMHDDLGADLTYISILGEMATQNSKLENENLKNNIHKIQDASKNVIDKMSEIIWAINSSNDSLPNLISYLHKYLRDFLESKNIACSVTIPEFIPDKKLTAAYRRNTFLIFKEAANNIVKHSGTDKVELVFITNKDELLISIKDFGEKTGQQDYNRKDGLGLKNMQRRAMENNGELKIIPGEQGGTLVEYQSKI